MLLVLKPLGVWGVCALAIVDSCSIPMPIDAIVIGYVAADHKKFVIYAFMAALGSAIGALVPYFVGRAGGELFLLKRVNRERYEKLRDRFEKQEFLAIMLPAMCPPPMPVKLFELGAGVFEMRVSSYFLAIASGKFVRFMIESILVIVYGPEILTEALHLMHTHLNLVLGGVGVLVLVIVVWVMRKVFDKRAQGRLPVEDGDSL